MEALKPKIKKKLPKRIRWISLFWALDAVLTVLSMIGFIGIMLSDDLFLMEIVIFYLLCITVRLGTEVSIFIGTPKMYPLMKVFFGLNIVVSILNFSPLVPLRTILLVTSLIIFWSGLSQEQTKDYFGVWISGQSNLEKSEENK
ncbi:hypothetical protein IW492_14945 [Enterococcus sp. BWB1-3]|uniref:hypothetical protein n=1 Tax=Enterococcus sp. BWB1-3 TaxID=2787713 RepID=UPI001924E99D|nr:hypothetical protein [Enterococcus sp. BWB1-3]MBL1230526.1 hypothetical protein [Enterococcus sp. BWB1-3]